MLLKIWLSQSENALGSWQEDANCIAIRESEIRQQGNFNRHIIFGSCARYTRNMLLHEKYSSVHYADVAISALDKAEGEFLEFTNEH